MTSLTANATKTGVRFRLCAEPENVRTARELAEAIIVFWGLRPLAEDAALIVSELFTNALRAARSVDLYLILTYEGQLVRLGVWDPSTELPVTGRCDPDAESGRGLHLIRALADDHGWYRVDDPPGKVVWAALRIRPGRAGAR